MTDTTTAAYVAVCIDCGRAIAPVTADQDDTPNTCDNCFFQQFGDMMTPRELRRMEDLSDENRRERDQLLAQYERAGIADDQDPSNFQLVVTAYEGDTAEDVGRRAADVAAQAFALRMATPDDA